MIALVQFIEWCSFQSAISILTGEKAGGGNNAPRAAATDRRQHEYDLEEYELRQREKARGLWHGIGIADGDAGGRIRVLARHRLAIASHRPVFAAAQARASPVDDRALRLA